MTPRLRRLLDLLRLTTRGGPAICNIAVTNACNAVCDFCNFAHDKGHVADRRFIDAEALGRALDLLYRRDVRYLTFQGGEPLLHPDLARMVAGAVARRMVPTVVTNGWLLPRRLDELHAAGLRTVFISIDSDTETAHECNRGLAGVCQRIRESVARMKTLGMVALASVTINRLIGSLDHLVPFLRTLGFEAVTFSYPRQAPLGSSSLVFSETSRLIDYDAEELIAAFDAIQSVRHRIRVHNPRPSVDTMQRHLRGEAEAFPCYGGYKHFYLDWMLDLYRCEAWREKMGSVWDLDLIQPIRDGCTACMTDCYRDSSVLLHFAVSLGDSLDHARRGRLLQAIGTLWRRPALQSLGALLDDRRGLAPLIGDPSA